MNKVFDFAYRRHGDQWAVVAIQRSKTQGVALEFYDNRDDAEQRAQELSGVDATESSSLSPYDNIYDV
jgi:hypothetical protein